jgi:signal transduction histidine kinase
MGRKRDLEARLSFLGFTEADRELLAGLRPAFERRAELLVAAFYRHLLSFPETRTILSDPDVKDRLIDVQRDYLLSLCGPQIDDDYVAERRRIGDAHERVGLGPRWYLGAYALYASLLVPVVCEQHRGNPTLAERTVTALLKLLLLDAQLAVESYIEKREAQLEYANRELAALTRELSREVEDTGTALRETKLRARAAEQLASVGTLVAGLAHEIGTPMGVIQGHAELLESSASDERSRWRAQTIGEQVGRISEIIRTLLNIARPRPPVRESVELATVLDTTLSFMTEKLRRRNVELECHFNAVRKIEGDHEKLQQLFLNLFLNAIDAMPEGGKLCVCLNPGSDGSVVVDVEDTGVGIKREAATKIFEPFYTTKEAGRGSGLGLMVARGIVHEHDGEIEVTSRPGQGTVFRIEFPVRGEEAGDGRDRPLRGSSQSRP